MCLKTKTKKLCLCTSASIDSMFINELKSSFSKVEQYAKKCEPTFLRYGNIRPNLIFFNFTHLLKKKSPIDSIFVIRLKSKLSKAEQFDKKLIFLMI